MNSFSHHRLEEELSFQNFSGLAIKSDFREQHLPALSRLTSFFLLCALPVDMSIVKSICGVETLFLDLEFCGHVVVLVREQWWLCPAGSSISQESLI